MNFEDVGVEVYSKEGKPFTIDEFNIICETLTRMGLANFERKELYQSCHLLHKKGKYRVLFFKELFLLDGKQAYITEEEYMRRNLIVDKLEKWGLLIPKRKVKIDNNVVFITLPYKKKKFWTLISKYTVGR